MKKRGRIFKASVVILTLFLVWIVVAPFLANYLIVEKPMPKADAILVLAGSSAFLERTQRAAELFKKGVAPKIYLTDDGEKAGWSQKEKRNPPFVDLARSELIAQGVPEHAIQNIKPEASGTFYEAKAMHETIRSGSVLIITSAYHSRRALWVFQKEFAKNNIQIEVGIEPALAGEQTPSPFFWWLSPHGWNLVGG